MCREIRRICVTNRHLCPDRFLERIERIAGERRADAVILREKDLSEEEYYKLAKPVLEICRLADVECILHTYDRVAEELGCTKIHLPLHIFSMLSGERKKKFDAVGSSVHSASQLVQAENLGAAYVTAGHIFDTSCKEGIPGRGLAFLEEMVRMSSIPVYGIGGIDEGNMEKVVRAGAAGVCMMSGFMIER